MENTLCRKNDPSVCTANKQLQFTFKIGLNGDKGPAFQMWPSKYNQPELCLFRTPVLATWLQAAGIRLHSAYFTA